MNEGNERLTPATVLQITNSLRLVGLRSSHLGTKLLNKSIQYVILNNIEFITLEEIYHYLHIKYNLNEYTIKSNINNALTNRNIQRSKENFEDVFDYEYDVLTFQPKNFIEELVRIICIES